MRKFVAGLALTSTALALVACAHGPDPEPDVRTQLVYVEKPVACVPGNLDSAGAYPDTDAALAAAAGPAERYALIWAGRLLRMARLGEVEPVILKCREAAGE